LVSNILIRLLKKAGETPSSSAESTKLLRFATVQKTFKSDRLGRLFTIRVHWGDSFLIDHFC
jgi:hypothetical protein